MRIVWLCHYFAPEIGAPQARLLETSRAFREQGHDVAVVTCFPNHPTGTLQPEDRGVRSRRDEMDGVAVHRCWSFVTPNRGFVKKLVGHLTFMFTAFGGLRRAAREGRPDVVIVSSPTFFSVFTAYVWCGLRRVPWVFEVRDLWPAIFVELGVLRSRVLVWMLERMELFLYRRATAVVTVTQAFADDIERRGIPRGKLATVRNGVQLDGYGPAERDAEFAASVGLDGKFVVLYLGAHGISHALSRVLEAAALLRDVPEIHFVLVGEGAEKEALVAEAGERGLTNVLFHAGVPKDEVPRWYALADAGLVPLRDVPLFRTFIPSKMFELMASGLPVVASVDGEARDILEESGAARIVPPEDAAAIAREIRRLHDDAALRAAMATAGRHFVEERFSRRRLALEYLDVLRTLVVRESAGTEG